MQRTRTLFVILVIALLAGCAGDNKPAATTPAPGQTRAHATLKATSNSHVSGTLQLVATDNGVHITGQVRGLQPDSDHGFHIHANGDCSAADAKSAGGHFNPANAPHGHPDFGPRHAGDMPNQHANADGVATVDVTAHDIELGTGSDIDVLGGAIIVHAKPDDYTSQPSGAAGARIACGVITAD
ncbi:MAG TPA: superoxide dismutase family protein [Oleiagrimonas sp.]|nr:superoxide dismutase family protein [Oleiagrimonas sp.]